MSPGFDHLVVAVPSLAEAIATARAAGFTVLPGGRHAELPTENALIAFADGGYLELLAARTAMSRVAARRLVRGPEWRAWRPRLDAIGRRFLPHLGRTGVCDLVLRGADLGAFAATARSRGIAAEGPLAMGRERPDGRVIAWELLVPDSFELPFLIADVSPREWRVPHDRDATTHPNGATGVATVSVRVRDIAGAIPRWQAWCGAEVRRTAQGAECALGGSGPLVRLTVGEPVGAVGASLLGILTPGARDPLAHWGVTVG